MKLPLFNIRVPFGVSWEELREQILKAIEEEKRQKTLPSIPSALSGALTIEMPSIPVTAITSTSGAQTIGMSITSATADLSTSGALTIEIPGTPVTAAAMIYGDATSVGFYFAETDEETSSQGVKGYATVR